MSESIPLSMGGDPPITTTPTPTFSPSRSDSSAQMNRRRRRRRVHRPAENSLYDIMHQHAGTSLFVRPIFWTDQHLSLLNIRFEQLPPCDTPVPFGVVDWPPSQGHLRPSPAIRTLSDSLSELLAPVTWQSVQNSIPVKTVMSQLWPDAFQSSRMLPELDLHFGAKTYRASVRAPLMWEFPVLGSPRSPYTPHGTVTKSYPTGLPMICYMGKRQLASVRRNLFRISPGPKGIINHPVARLQRLRSKMLCPTNRDEDPHLAGIFLAMAQRHFLESGETNTDTRFLDVKLRILMDDADKSAFAVYTAIVTRRFLERFHDPYKVPGGKNVGLGDAPGMKIEYTEVPFWPILGLRERLGKALGQDIVGSFDPDLIETWVDEEPTEMNKSSKRKRGALSEVVNASFEEDTEEEVVDEPALGGKKRCLSEGPPVGLVV